MGISEVVALVFIIILFIGGIYLIKLAFKDRNGFLKIAGIAVVLICLGIMAYLLVDIYAHINFKTDMGKVTYVGYDKYSKYEIITVRVGNKYIETNDIDIIREYSDLEKGNMVEVNYDMGEIISIND